MSIASSKAGLSFGLHGWFIDIVYVPSYANLGNNEDLLGPLVLFTFATIYYSQVAYYRSRQVNCARL